MNGRPEGPSPAILAAQRRLEALRRSRQLPAGRAQWPVASELPVASASPANPALEPASSQSSLHRLASDRSLEAEDHAISLHPSIALAMLKAGHAAPGRIWLLFRHLDQAGQGWLRLDRAQQTLCHKESELRVCGRRQLRNLLRQGQGIFWDRDKSRIWLRSAARVAIALQVDRLRGRPVMLPLNVLLAGMGQVRAHFYATFHSGRQGHEGIRTGNPINRETLRKITHVPARTQRLYERQAGVAVQSNMAVGERFTESNLQERAWRHGRATFLFTDHDGNQGPAGARYLAWRLPNSYQGPHLLSPKGRTKKINHQIDLVNSRAQGNDLYRTTPCKQVAVRLTFDRLFHASGQEASRAYNRDQDRDIYWTGGRSRAGSRRLWRVLPAREGRLPIR